jgi:hypothetical protein
MVQVINSLSSSSLFLFSYPPLFPYPSNLSPPPPILCPPATSPVLSPLFFLLLFFLLLFHPLIFYLLIVSECLPLQGFHEGVQTYEERDEQSVPNIWASIHCAITAVLESDRSCHRITFPDWWYTILHHYYPDPCRLFVVTPFSFAVSLFHIFPSFESEYHSSKRRYGFMHQNPSKFGKFPTFTFWRASHGVL